MDIKTKDQKKNEKDQLIGLFLMSICLACLMLINNPDFFSFTSISQINQIENLTPINISRLDFRQVNSF